MFQRRHWRKILFTTHRLKLGLLLLLVGATVLLRASLPTGEIVQPTAATSNFLQDVRLNPDTIVGQQGFFRVGKSVKDRWWLIDPNGQPFFYRGVTSVGDGRGIFPTISPESEYTEILQQKYGKDEAEFRADTFKRLREWQFNAVGAWTASDFWDTEMPYTIVLDFVKTESKIREKAYGVKVPDVFDPQWVEEIDAKAKELILPRRDSPLLVGYFTDNELGFGDIESVDRRSRYKSTDLFVNNLKPSLLQVCLSLDPNRPAYEAAWNFVLERHGNSEAQVFADWRLNNFNRDTLKRFTQRRTAIVSRPFLADHREFLHLFAQKYFETTAQVIRRYDPNHLILGCRFGGPPSLAVLSAMQPEWVDVVSANNYRLNMYERLDIYARATGLPLLLTEFSWGHNTFANQPLPNEPNGGLSLTDRMIRNGEQVLAKAITHPAVIGYTWYRWVDQPTGQPPYIPPVSLGLVTLKDQPNRYNTEAIARINAKAEAIATTDFGYEYQTD